MSEISCERLHSGAWQVSTVHNGRRVAQVYYGYTKAQARQAFRSYLSTLN